MSIIINLIRFLVMWRRGRRTVKGVEFAKICDDGRTQVLRKQPLTRARRGSAETKREKGPTEMN